MSTETQNGQVATPAAQVKSLDASLHLSNQIGMQLSVNVASVAEAYRMMREFGRLGWTSGTLPVGGLRLPLAMADTFDWSLIGAHEATLDGTNGVWYRNQFYKRRELAANPNKKMGECIKYSRGASETDDPTAVEGEGNFQYVTLAIFRGAGRAIPALQRPQ